MSSQSLALVIKAVLSGLHLILLLNYFLFLLAQLSLYLIILCYSVFLSLGCSDSLFATFIKNWCLKQHYGLTTFVNKGTFSLTSF